MYYEKYLKYKTKYLNILKGGIVPQIDCDLLPFENININIIYKGRFILRNNDDTNNNYLLNDNYEFEKTQNQVNQPLFNISDLSMLANLNVKLGCDFIPFHIGSLQFNFNIIIGIIEYVDHYNYILQTKKIKISNKIKEFKKYITSKIFHIDRTTYVFIGISNHNSILNCFSFFNKLHEFLNYILLNNQTIDELFPNIENIKDFYNIYSSFYDTKSKECAIKKYSQSSKDIFYADIKKFKDFINNCNDIDKHIEFKSMFGISLINLILINWIYLRSLRTNLVVGSLSSNLYPISKLNFLENIFQMSEKNIHDYTEEQKQLNNKNDINKLLLKKMDVPIIPYGQSTYKGDSFPNCVENIILQLLKILAWEDDKYNIDLLPEGISEGIKNIIKRINQEPLKIETKKIMDDFVILVSAIKYIDYRYGQNQKDHNIASNKKNVGNILNYIFNDDTVIGGIENYNDQIFEKINDNTDKYRLQQKDDTIIIDKNSFKINIIIKDGHTFIGNKINTIYDLINTYKYLSIIYTFNYTKDDNINLDRNFANFCIGQKKDIKNFLTNKIINIQNISLKEYNSKDEGGNSCLHVACIVGSLEKLQEYIKYADINNIDNGGNTALIIASTNCHIECIKLLIENGADVNIGNIEGDTPLIFASSIDHIECVKLLIEKGAIIDKANKASLTSLLWASREDSIECVKLLIEKGADINKTDKDNNTSLILASTYGHIECVKLLIENRADINNTDKDGNTSLTLASSNGHFECVKLLIEKGAIIDKPNKYYITPLLWASREGYNECVKLLIENHANVNMPNDKYTPLSLASSNGHSECVKLLIENHANVNMPNYNNDTPLTLASSNGHSECVKLLIKKGANVNSANDVGDTSFSLVSKYCSIECVKLLIENNLNVNYTNIVGYTPLSFASQNGCLEIIDLLIKKGAYINNTNINGDTPLSLASKNGHLDCVKLLIEKNANINHINNKEHTPLLLASYAGHTECVNLLQQYDAH